MLLEQLPEPPPDYLVLAACGILCCQCIGPLALWHAEQCRTAIAHGDPSGAVHHSRKALKFSMASIVIGMILSSVYLFIYFTYIRSENHQSS